MASDVLLVAKFPDMQRDYAAVFDDLGHTLVFAGLDGAQWTAPVGDAPALILIDLEGDREGLDRLLDMGRRHPGVPFIVLSDQDDWTQAVAAMKAGASECLRKPVDVTAMRAAVRKALLSDAPRYAESLPGSVPEKYSMAALVGNSPAMRQVHDLIRRVGHSDATVLLLGESGTGKELVARVIHHHSRRAGHAFVALNCGAVPSELMESELFGHEKGSFTGAITSRKGRFELAARGTLLLDEIGEMSPQMQVKLLRVLQERSFEPVGSVKSLPADARIVAATHRDLEAAINQGLFREDLFYRLNVFPIPLPPLRERLEDIPALAEHILRRFEAEGRDRVEINAAAMEVMMQYPWTGNVRELQNILERLVILYPSEKVGVAQLPAKILPDNIAIPVRSREPLPRVDEQIYSERQVLPADGDIDLKQHLEQIERDLILQSLALSDGVVARAAARLNLKRTTLVEKIKKLGIKITDPDMDDLREQEVA